MTFSFLVPFLFLFVQLWNVDAESVDADVIKLYNTMKASGDSADNYYAKLILAPNTNTIDVGQTFDASAIPETVQGLLDILKQVYDNIVQPSPNEPHLVMFKRREGSPIIFSWKKSLFDVDVKEAIDQTGAFENPEFIEADQFLEQIDCDHSTK